MKRNEAKEKLSKGAASGMVALVFLILGFQLAVFVLKVVARPAEESSPAPALPSGDVASAAAPDVKTPERSKYGGYERPAKYAGAARKPAPAPTRTYESFAFDPNTVSVADLQRLGLSERQAESIENYRGKGGRFRSKADFRKMYVVSDTLYARLEPFIEITKLELNTADSAALVTLRGIGPWYARKILDYRERLGGFVAPEQLLEIDGFDADRYAGLADGVTVDRSRVRRLDLWRASDTALARHPYLGPKGARSIVRYRSLYDSAHWTLTDLVREGALTEETAEKIKKYIEIQ